MGIFLLAVCQQLSVDRIVDTYTKQAGDTDDYSKDKPSGSVATDDIHGRHILTPAISEAIRPKV